HDPATPMLSTLSLHDALPIFIDDGKGMSMTDARMSFERHATSKIRASADLFAIRTFGFRGEALASIAAVAQVDMKTRTTEVLMADRKSTRLNSSHVKISYAVF